MTKRFLALSTLAVSLFTASAALAADPRATSGAAIEKALQEYMRPGEMQKIDANAVPRTDKAEATVIGKIVVIDDVDFLDDGTPYRFVILEPKRPFTQDVYLVCLGSSAANACGRLIEGRRVQFTADLVVADEGESTGLALLVVKKIRT